MSFQFLKRSQVTPEPCPGFGSDHFRIDEYHPKLMWHSGPFYNELIVPLSLYAFNRLSPSDKKEQQEEIRGQHEGSDFTELFKKLHYRDQVKFLSEVLRLLKFERLLLAFKQLDTEQQQQLNTELDLFSCIINPDPKETEEHCRLRIFKQIYKSRPWKNFEELLARKGNKKNEDDQQEEASDDKENNLDWNSCFSEIFLGFSIIWFQGQWACDQDMLIEQLSKGVTGDVIKKCLPNESEEDFKIARFTELCKKVTNIRVQERFLDNAEKKLRRYNGLFLEPQEREGAATLFSDISTLGFSLLSAKHQHEMIEEMSTQVETSAKTKRHLAAEVLQTSTTDPGKAIRIGRFRELFNQVSVFTRIHLFRELRISLKHKQYSEAVQIFCGLGSEDQAKMIKELTDTKISGESEEGYKEQSRNWWFELMKFCTVQANIYTAAVCCKSLNSSTESEKNIRLRSFKMECVDYLSNRDKERVRQGTSDHNEEDSSYAEFLIDASILWFKARCKNFKRNPIHIILSSEVEEIEKLPEESEEDFRLRRFTDSFMQLPLDSQERIFDHIYHRLITDLDYHEGTQWETRPAEFAQEMSCRVPSEGRDLFDSEWIKLKLPDLQGQRAAASTTTTTTTTTTQVVSAAAPATTTRWTLFSCFSK
ncbi:uncharacterized protein LOC126805260 [Argentina anserina]|uniref:uncharacterized protein LOC126805260 n=1 Tax=Argentina anserina TaxID=57926 RepID=UPI00217658EF|nr:uncharacterized protein LOC126805260 [Potentilla anserina]